MRCVARVARGLARAKDLGTVEAEVGAAGEEGVAAIVHHRLPLHRRAVGDVARRRRRRRRRKRYRGRRDERVVYHKPVVAGAAKRVASRRLIELRHRAGKRRPHLRQLCLRECCPGDTDLVVEGRQGFGEARGRRGPRVCVRGQRRLCPPRRLGQPAAAVCNQRDNGGGRDGVHRRLDRFLQRGRGHARVGGHCRLEHLDDQRRVPPHLGRRRRRPKLEQHAHVRLGRPQLALHVVVGEVVRGPEAPLRVVALAVRRCERGARVGLGAGAAGHALVLVSGVRLPQSEQSLPSGQLANCELSPPSSQCASLV